MLDPQASQLQVAKKARHDEVEETETTKDWYTGDAVMRMQGIFLEPGQAGYKEARARAVSGLPERPHRHKPLADAGWKEYYFEKTVQKETEKTSKTLDFTQKLDNVGDDDFKTGLKSVLPGQAKKTQMLTASSSGSAGQASGSSGSNRLPGQAGQQQQQQQQQQRQQQQGAIDNETYKTAYNAVKAAINGVNNECTKADMNDDYLKTLTSQPGQATLATAYQQEIARLKPLLQDQANKAREALAFFSEEVPAGTDKNEIKVLVGQLQNLKSKLDTHKKSFVNEMKSITEYVKTRRSASKK